MSRQYSIIIVLWYILRYFAEFPLMMESSYVICSLTPLLLAVLATAATQAETLFSCTTTQGKQLQIETQGDTLHYRYGKAGKPELEFSQPRHDIDNGSCSSEGKHHDWLVMSLNGNEYMIMAESGHRQRATLDVYLNANKSSSLTLTCLSNSIHNRLSQLSSLSSPCGQ